jgi:D-inositol-3-phosphate glycosyltransferase
MSLSVAMLSIHTSPLDNPGRTKDAGGMNVYMRELARELGQQRVTVDIFTRNANKYTPLFSVVQLCQNVRVISIKAGPMAPVSKHALYQYLPAFTRHIEQFRRSESKHYDILHSHYWLSGAAAMQLAAQWDIPHVTMFHTLGRLKQMANPNAPEPPLRLQMEQRIIQHADRIIATTIEERTQIIRSYGACGNRVVAIPCGVDLKRFVAHDKQAARRQLGVDAERPLLLFVGRLDPFKGPDVLLRAASMMQEEAQVVIVGGNIQGNDPDIQSLRQLAADLQIDDRVSFLGARPQQELPLLYSAADVTVVPSYHESFGLVAVESQACGTPVVATRAGGLTTVVRNGETGYLVPRCSGFFAERLDTLLRNPALHEQMSRAARPFVSQFSWKSVANQMLAVYDELVGELECGVAL